MTQIITLGNGKVYQLSPLSLGHIKKLEKRFGKHVKELEVTDSLEAINYLLFLRLRGNYPELTEDGLRELVPLRILKDIIREVTKF